MYTHNQRYVHCIQLSGRAVEKVKGSRKIVDDIVDGGTGRLFVPLQTRTTTSTQVYNVVHIHSLHYHTHAVVYGINTGFGALGDNIIRPDQLE